MEKRRAFLVENEGKELEDYRDRYNLKMSALRLKWLETDAEKAYRLKVCECRYCRYMGAGIVMDAFTKYTCQRCGERHYHHNSGVPILCMTCGQEEGVCVQCGNKM